MRGAPTPRILRHTRRQRIVKTSAPRGAPFSPAHVHIPQLDHPMRKQDATRLEQKDAHNLGHTVRESCENGERKPGGAHTGAHISGANRMCLQAETPAQHPSTSVPCYGAPQGSHPGATLHVAEPRWPVIYASLELNKRATSQRRHDKARELPPSTKMYASGLFVFSLLFCHPLPMTPSGTLQRQS